VKWLLRLLFTQLWKTKLINFDRLSFSEPTIIMPNHVSLLDALVLYAFLPSDVYFVVNTDIAARIGFILRWVNYITVDPLNPYSLKRIVGVIRKGKTIVLFPEGRITTTGGLMKIYNGIGFIALKTGVTIYPVILSGLQYSKFTRIKDKVRSRCFPAVDIYIDHPIRLQADKTKSFKLQKKEMSDKILAVMQNAIFRAKQHQLPKTANLFNEFLKAGQLHGMNKIMAEDIIGTISYKKAIIGSYVLSAKLQKLLAVEENAGVLLPNSIGHVVTLFALLYGNKTLAVLNFSAGIQNNLDCAEAAGLKTILTSRVFIEKAGFAETIHQLANRFRIVYLEDVQQNISIVDKLKGLSQYYAKEQALGDGKARIILFTSGSEGKPKGVVLRQANILANIQQVACAIAYTPRDKMLNALPMFHSFGLTAGTLLPILGGLEVFLYPSPLHYKIIPEIAYDRNITVLMGTPTFLLGYGKYAHNYDFYNVRYVLAGGEKLKNEVRTLWQEKFGLRILEGYGITETAPVLALNTPLVYRAGTVGKFLPGIEWRIEAVEGIEEGGNLLVKGPNIMEGYLLSGKGFVPAQEWYNCGDVVAVDDDGFVTIKSRLKRFAKISGEMISLDAVERAAESCFATDKNAAINIIDAKRGEKIILYTLQKTATKQMLREYLTHTRQSMLSLPAELYVVEKLPLLGNGKIDYVALKAMADRGTDSNEG
jgi:acyl-[acyl-carrier-protein]-phospholipid O-acyltransferase/long-chain-fatty-acid--[acyl-carrier-protein] ligase